MKKIELTEEQKNEVINLYKNTNLSILDIAGQFGSRSKEVIYRVLKENNIKKRRSVKNKILISDYSKIVQSYLNGISVVNIAQDYSVTSNVIYKVLEDSGIDNRQNHKKYSVNSNYFNTIDTPEKAYIFGYISADGFVREDLRALELTVHNQDLDLLIKIKDRLETDAPIYNVKNKPHSRLTICNKQICVQLNRHGCHNKKSFTLKFPKIDNNLVSHYIRGYLDGDGCISITKRNKYKYFSLSFAGTLDIIANIKEFLNVKSEITFHNSIYHINIGKKEDVVRCLDILYNESTLHLDRKYEKYLEIQSYIKGEE